MISRVNYTPHLLFCKSLLVLFLLFCINIEVSAQEKNIFQLPFPEQYEAMKQLTTELALFNRDSAESELAKLEELALAANDELSLLNFKVGMIHYRYLAYCHYKENPVTQELIREGNQFLKEVDQNKHPVIAGMTHFILGHLMTDESHDYYDAFEHYLKAYSIFTSIPESVYPDKQYSQYLISLAYYKFNDFEKSLELSREIDFHNPEGNFIFLFNMNLIGMSLFKLKRFEDARTVFQSLLKTYPKYNVNRVWEGILRGNIGETFASTAEVDSAITYLEQAVTITSQDFEPENVIGFASELSKIYMNIGDFESAKHYADIAQQYLSKTSDISHFSEVYHSLSRYYRTIGRNDIALAFQDSAIIFSDSLVSISDINLKFKAEMAIEKEKANNREKLFLSEQSRLKTLRNSSITIGISFILVLILLFNRSLIKNRNEKKILEIEEHRVQEELILAQAKLKEYTHTIIEKNKHIEKAASELLKAKKASQSDGYSKFDENDDALADIKSSMILSDDGWNRFINLFEKVHPGFFLRLNDKYPQLSFTEKKFIALSKLRMDTKEMALIMCVSNDAIRQCKSRVRKKLELKDQMSIEEVIDQV